MWLIQDQHLVRLPDDVPVPPGSVQVEVPDDFLVQPEAYKVEENRIVRRSEKDMQALQQGRQALKLTQEEIARIKQAIAEGKL
jgi:hypothetical protein